MTDEEVRKRFQEFMACEAPLRKVAEVCERFKELIPTRVMEAMGTADAVKNMENAQRMAIEIQPALDSIEKGRRQLQPIIEAMDAISKATGGEKK